jgi:uncharacterized repeat protein (TIGR02543 family)
MGLNANGGSVSPTTMTRDYKTKVGTLPTPTRSGYAFDGWYTSATGGTNVSANTIVTSDIVYYAHWIKDIVIKDASKISEKGFHNPIKWMIQNGITTSNPYNPQGKVTREQMAAFMYRLAGSPPLTAAQKSIVLKDVKSVSEPTFMDPIKWMISSGVSTSNPFNPRGQVTREQMAAFMYRFAGSPTLNNSAKSISIKDASKISETAFRDPIKWMIYEGITVSNPYNPQGKVTREQMAAFMYRFNKNVYQRW